MDDSLYIYVNDDMDFIVSKSPPPVDEDGEGYAYVRVTDGVAYDEDGDQIGVIG